MVWLGKHYKPYEFDGVSVEGHPMPGTGERHISPVLVEKLDIYHEALSAYLGYDICIHIHENGGWSVKGHSATSQHYLGLAADLHATNKKTGARVSLVDMYIVAEKLGIFGGIGVYDWGLHLDDRVERGARWDRTRIKIIASLSITTMVDMMA